MRPYSFVHLRHHFLSAFPAFFLALAPCAGTAGSSPTVGGNLKPDEPAVHTVARGLVHEKVKLDAWFESDEMYPLKLVPKAVSDLTVLHAVAHGARVRKDDVLVRLDTEKIEDQIADLEEDRPGALLGLELATAELENLEKSTPGRLDAARRSQRNAEEDLSYFEKVGREQREKNSQYGIKSSVERLDNAQEELTQLKKMYEADDLTEETEEIILKRQRFAVESAEFGLQTAKLNAELLLQTTLPRDHETLKAAKRDQALSRTLSEEAIPRALGKKRIEVEKMRRDQTKARKRLADLKSDLASLSIRSPVDGIVYYGACENGKWTTGSGLSKKLLPNGKLSPNEVFMTIVNPQKMHLQSVLQESDLAVVEARATGTAVPTAAPKRKLSVQLEEVGEVPMPGGGFEGRFSFKASPDFNPMPGMSCKVTLPEGNKPENLIVPKESVFSEGADRYVYLVRIDTTPEKRTVKTGESDAKNIEILDGLKEGDKILLSKP